MHSLFFMGRHGETMLNDSGRYRGWSNGPDAHLNSRGIESAHAQGRYLSTLGQKFAKIICSPLDRAQHTAAIIAGYVGIKVLELDDRLRPLHVGDLAGELKADHPIQPFLDKKNKRFPNGENVNEYDARQHSFATYLLDQVEAVKQDDDWEILVLAHVSNIMYWWNLQSGSKHEEYLDESSDIVLPGGLAIITDHAVVPIFKANEDSEAEGGDGELQIDSSAVKGEPGTGYEDGDKGDFACDNCEYFRVSDSSCGQKDMMEKSKRPRTEDNRVKVQETGCCEYVDRLGK